MKKRTLPSKPTIEAMQYMSYSLRDKFKKCASIQLSLYGYMHQSTSEPVYYVYVEGKYSSYVNTWNEVKLIFDDLMTGVIPNE